MQIYPALFKNYEKNDQRAAVLLHELMHVWFKDQKIRGSKVNETEEALKLAMAYPSKARRSPENYERFCLAVWRDG
ncbi:MAG: hypothetical protein DWP94_11610 [Flavobacterium sp.]|nr:MAG: hypothetical protein DWP94_11610 [Flavobacterium sp.]